MSNINDSPPPLISDSENENESLPVLERTYTEPAKPSKRFHSWTDFKNLFGLNPSLALTCLNFFKYTEPKRRVTIAYIYDDDTKIITYQACIFRESPDQKWKRKMNHAHNMTAARRLFMNPISSAIELKKDPKTNEKQFDEFRKEVRKLLFKKPDSTSVV